MAPRTSGWDATGDSCQAGSAGFGFGLGAGFGFGFGAGAGFGAGFGFVPWLGRFAFSGVAGVTLATGAS